LSEIQRSMTRAAGMPAVERARTARYLSGIGIAGVVLAVVVIGALHLTPPTSQISPVRRTLSEYGLSDLAWVFNLGVLALAFGSAAVFAAQVVGGRLRRFSPGHVFAAIWVLGMLALVVFPKHNWAIGPSTSGTVHRIASLLAFLALPVAVMVLVRAGRAASAAGRWAFGVAAASYLWFLWIFAAMVVAGTTRWWTAVPLGVVERGLAFTELLAIVLFAVDLLKPVRSVRSR
jgi:hypothetical protein